MHNSISGIAQAKIYLNEANRNIQRIKELSRLNGISYCCIGALEKRQSQLETALNTPLRSNGSLGFLPALAVWGVGIAITTISGIVTAAWWHKRNTDVELLKQENVKYAMENNLDPSSFCPANPASPTENLISTVKGVVILGAVTMVFVMLSKIKR